MRSMIGCHKIFYDNPFLFYGDTFLYNNSKKNHSKRKTNKISILFFFYVIYHFFFLSFLSSVFFWFYSCCCEFIVTVGDPLLVWFLLVLLVVYWWLRNMYYTFRFLYIFMLIERRIYLLLSDSNWLKCVGCLVYCYEHVLFFALFYELVYLYVLYI